MDMSEHDRLPAGLRGELRRDEPMSRHVSWRAGGRARLFYQPADVLDLSAFLRTRDPAEPVLFVGLGSNLLVRDGGIRGSCCGDVAVVRAGAVRRACRRCRRVSRARVGDRPAVAEIPVELQ